MKSFSVIFILLINLTCSSIIAQDIYDQELTFDEVVQLAREQSPDAIMAKHRYRAKFWEFSTFKAEFRPSVRLSTTFPNLNRSYSEFDDSTGTYYVKLNKNTTNLNLDITQNIPYTGGQLSVRTDLSRLDNLEDDTYSYNSTPFSITYSQPVLFYNEFRWQKKIEPLKYEEAKGDYISAMEDVALKAVNYFFDLALAQQNLQVAKINYSNADTLYQIANGRYNIGTIAENELMQMELSLLNAGSSLNSSKVDLEIKKYQLRSFLGFNEKVNLQLIIPKVIPKVDVNVEQALEIARVNNPEILNFERQLIESERDVAKAKSQKGVQASLFASLGYTQQAAQIKDAYVDPQSQQNLTLGMQIPILDWKLGKGRYKMAQSSQEVIRTTVDQARTDFVQNVYLNVMQFNLQDDQFVIAAKTDTIAQKRYDMTKQRFLIGKVDVLDLNVALSEKDAAKINYISALRKYWSNFYSLRRITLYDFIKDESLGADFDELIE
ncbi:MAG: TolC family protein [Bacteroidales bacterium]|nr:TolC family protein [Bacteroidales bacterium]